MLGLLCCAVVLPVTRLSDYGLEERRGEEAGELAVGGGGHGQVPELESIVVCTKADQLLSLHLRLRPLPVLL
jgi:hypothetical protein